MKTAILTKSAYQYHELSIEAKEKAKQDYLEMTSDILVDDFKYSLKDTLKEEFGLENLDTLFSLSNCQGDGLCLYGAILPNYEIFDNPKFRQIALNGLKGGQIKSVKENLYKIEFTHRNNHYYHARTVEISFVEMTHATTDKQTELLNKVHANIKKWYFDFCREWEKNGYEWFYEISDDAMDDYANSNDYYFDENGTILYGYEIQEAV